MTRFFVQERKSTETSTWWENRVLTTNQKSEMMHDCFFFLFFLCFFLWILATMLRRPLPDDPANREKFMRQQMKLFFLWFRVFRVNVLLTIDFRITHMYWLDIVQLYCTVIIRTMVLSQMMLELGLYIQNVVVSRGPNEQYWNIFTKVKNPQHGKFRCFCGHTWSRACHLHLPVSKIFDIVTGSKLSYLCPVQGCSILV